MQEISNKTNNIDISIVIVNYNVRDFLNNCLHSIYKSETKLNYEIIVVDNNSTDKSVAFLKDKFPQVKFIELKDNLGFSKANNIGFKEANGKYVLILNPDTIINPDTLQVMYNYMEEHPEVALSGCKVLNADGSFQYACRRGFPTPWASFTKLFGLQAIFPKSKLFAQYNQTFRPTDETYYIDALIGAFMFARLDVIKKINGFDEDFFMYGEDIDICYRIHEAGHKVAYVHSTSITHFKGESTRRSSINEIRHFYEAMEIYVKKHYANSLFFLFLLRIAIAFRSFLAYLETYKKDIPVIIVDLLIANISLLIATSFKFERFFGFPSYAYPTVFIVISLLSFGSLFFVGEYFEGENSYRKTFFGYLITFFILSALTYFFKNYAFSRGVVLLTIGFSITFSFIFRFILNTIKSRKIKSEKSRTAILFNYSKWEELEANITKLDFNQHYDLVGLFYFDTNQTIQIKSNDKIMGNYEFLKKNIKEFNLNDVIIITDNSETESYNDLINKTIGTNIKLHFVKKLEEFYASQIINSVSNNPVIIKNYRIILPRYKFAKRTIDIISSLIMLTICLPVTIYKNSKNKKYFKDILNVLKGKYSLIGVYPVENIRNYNAKPGLLNLVRFANKDISEDAIKKLNDYYELNYSLSLDFDIFIKSLI